MYRVVIKSTAGAEHVLCNGGTSHAQGEHVGPDGWDKQTTLSEQPVRPIRGTRATVFNRGNKLTTIAFSVAVELADNRAAGVYALTYEDALPTKGTLYVSAIGDAGATTIKTMTNASIGSIRVRPVGRTVLISYTISGGGLQ